MRVYNVGIKTRALLVLFFLEMRVLFLYFVSYSLNSEKTTERLGKKEKRETNIAMEIQNEIILGSYCRGL